MKLSQKEFQRLLQDKKLVLSLIGMSNIGKTYWSTKLAKLNFKHFNCDSLIEAKLSSLLKRRGYSGIKDVSRWMGQPYERRFSTNQQKYLKFEEEIIKNIFKKIKNTRENVVVDTTGSIVHLNHETCRALRKKTLVVYIKATNAKKKKMFENYIANPKPVVFADVFRQKKGESDEAALHRSYFKLLNKRSKLYARYADVTIPYKLNGKSAGAEMFISLIQKKL